MPRDTCQWLRHLILTTQSIILPVKVKLDVIYINFIDVCSECQRHLAASFPNNIDVVRGFVLKEVEEESRMSCNFGNVLNRGNVLKEGR